MVALPTENKAGAEPPAAGGQWRFVIESSDTAFSKKYAFLVNSLNLRF